MTGEQGGVMESLNFLKMEGTGNDYIFLDALGASGGSASSVPAVPGAEEIRRWSDRHTGIGGDGVVVIAPPSTAGSRARMLMFNADGSPSAMCGNALRCIALHLYQQSGDREFVLESGAGRHRARILEERAGEEAYIEIEMGAPDFAAERVPFLPAHAADRIDTHGPLVDVPLALAAGGTSADLSHLPPVVRAVILSMGNPHCVLFVEDADRADLELIGPVLEHHPAFPARTNVEFVSADGQGLYQRTFERGSGETLSCGSGACAVHVAAVLTGRAGPVGRIRVRGGVLELEWRGSVGSAAPVFMRGPARVVFRGSVRL